MTTLEPLIPRRGCVQHDCAECQARAALSAPAVPKGWKLVPIEPTPEMVLNALESERIDWIGHCNLPQSIYSAMIAAAPQPQEPQT